LEDFSDSSIDSANSLNSISKDRRRLNKKQRVLKKQETKKDIKSSSRERHKLDGLQESNSSRVSSIQSCLGTIEALEKFPKLGQHAHLVEAPVFRQESIF